MLTLFRLPNSFCISKTEIKSLFFASKIALKVLSFLSCGSAHDKSVESNQIPSTLPEVSLQKALSFAGQFSANSIFRSLHVVTYFSLNCSQNVELAGLTVGTSSKCLCTTPGLSSH